MADRNTVGQLKKYVAELEDLFEYFSFDKIYCGGKLDTVVARESKVSNDIVIYDYDAIYKKIDDVIDKIERI